MAAQGICKINNICSKLQIKKLPSLAVQSSRQSGSHSTGGLSSSAHHSHGGNFCGMFGKSSRNLSARQHNITSLRSINVRLINVPPMLWHAGQHALLSQRISAARSLQPICRAKEKISALPSPCRSEED